MEHDRTRIDSYFFQCLLLVPLGDFAVATDAAALCEGWSGLARLYRVHDGLWEVPGRPAGAGGGLLALRLGAETTSGKFMDRISGHNAGGFGFLSAAHSYCSVLAGNWLHGSYPGEDFPTLN